mgnify:FL=1
MARNNGASQFTAFAALTGFEDLIEEHNQIYESPREPLEEELQKLFEKMRKVRKDSEISLTFFNNGRYETISGIVSSFDLVYRIITIDRKILFLDDIIEIKLPDDKDDI